MKTHLAQPQGRIAVLPIETRADWPQTYRRRVTTCKAMRVTEDTMPQVAAWTHGHMWAGSVVVPDGLGGELTAGVGDVVLRFGTVHAVMSADTFHAAWRAET